MLVPLRRMRKWQWVRLMVVMAGLAACMFLASWEQLEHHVVSHMRSYSYRYLVNSYAFLNHSLSVGADARGLRPHDRPHFLIDHERKCAGAEDVLLLLFVKSSPENADRRRAIRATWGNETYARRELGAGVRVLFALGVHEDARSRRDVQQELLREDAAHADLVQGDFLDTFRNLTAKLLLQLRWARTRCPDARFLMSADDDVFVHTPNLVRYLRGLVAREGGAGGRDLWVGRVHRGAPPVRRRESKYYVPREMYPWTAYPDYTAGAGYVVSADVAERLYRASATLNASLYIDDVFMGVCGKVAGVSPREHPYFSGEGRAPDHPCVYGEMMTSHGHVADLRRLWAAATHPAVRGVASGLAGRLYCTAVKALLLCRPDSGDTYPCRAAFT